MTKPPVPEIDIQAQKISAGLDELYAFLDHPVARNALELMKNATTAAQFDILRRLRQSLNQYLERKGRLFYVGLLGHFSAGKSSTINSLLGIGDAQKARAVGLNPTDTGITLITQEENAPSLYGVAERGHVEISLQTINSPILKNIVLVDTPGTGDPKFLEEVARDFLPMCDVILFVFSAASPFDKSDIPMLVELHERLPFVHLHFVVTRAEEMRLDRYKPINESNLDTSKRDSFLSEVIGRINTALVPQTYKADDFILIDNHDAYNISTLSGFITSRCDPTNTYAQIAMHGAKMHFFNSNARHLREYFAGVLEKKLLEISSIVGAAKRNIDRYQENVQISNSNLTQAWIEKANNIGFANNRAIERSKAQLSLPVDIRHAPLVVTKRHEVANDLASDADFSAISATVRLRSDAITLLQNSFYESLKPIFDMSLEKWEASSHVMPPITFATSPNKIDVFSTQLLSRRCNEIRDAEASALRELSSDLRRFIKELHDVLVQRAPLADCIGITDLARKSLKTDLDKFFQTVELYRSGVFSHKTKDPITALGIGDRLDELDKEFTDDDRATLSAKAMEDISRVCHRL